MIKIIFAFAFMLLATATTFAQIPSIIEKDGRHSLLVDGKPFLILGGQAHNSSGWPAVLPHVWQSAQYMHLNTLEVPIYWEQVEPTEGEFDFSLIDTLLAQARLHKMHLVLLWFATWKNGSNHYMPAWMKMDAAKYPNITGKDGKPVDSPSPHTDATLQADKKAFASVMLHLKKADLLHTVIMVQVENEPGAWGSVRDYSTQAQLLFEGAVPAELLKPELLKTLNAAATAGTWKQVFGERADEYFHAWYVARFIGEVAAVGKAAYPLPVYVNAALRDPLTNPPATHYESGGPTDNVIPIWKVAATAIDIEAPDIYLSGNEKVLKVLDLYARNDNALFVPEAGLNAVNAKYFYAVLAHGGIGFSPFGIDDNGDTSRDEKLTERLTAFAHEYAIASTMMRELAKWSFDGKIKSVVEGDDHTAQTTDLGAWQAIVFFGGSGRGNAAPTYDEPTGKAMFVQLDENKFIVIATKCHITFQPTGNNTGKAWQYVKVEEGYYKNGTFVPLRILNGDETDWGGPGFGTSPNVLQVSLVVR
ncbi:GH35 family beta-galactosidase GalD [soil metagenome]